jgi:hypothetical protein
MREVIELRLGNDIAQRILPDDVGTRIGPNGFVRKLELGPADPWMARLSAEDAEARRRGRSVILYWDIRRQYTAAELANAKAELIQLVLNIMFEPAGEECRTLYDYSGACPVCGAGRVQVSDLTLDINTIPKRADIAFTIARDELVFSERLANLIEEEGFSGVTLRTVRHDGRKPPDSAWFQPVFTSSPVVAVEPTTYGDRPYGPYERSPCPPGHVMGNRVVSELYVERNSWDGSDFVRTRDLVGVKQGLAAPYPLLLVSQKCWGLLKERKFKGFIPEVVNLLLHSAE